MGAFSFPRRFAVRHALTLMTLAGLVLMVAAATLVRAAESTKTGDRGRRNLERPKDSTAAQGARGRAGR